MIQVGEGRPDHFHWIEARTGCVLSRNARVLVAWRHGIILGMVAFDGWTPNAVEFHMALDSPLAWRRLHPLVLDYAFQHAARNVVIGVIPSHNKRSLKLARHLCRDFIKRKLGVAGEAHRVADGWAPGDDLVIYEIRRQHVG